MIMTFCRGLRTINDKELIEGAFIRQARKQYRCEGDGSSKHRRANDCSGSIEPRQIYVEYLGETGAFQSGSRHCSQCAFQYFTMEAK